jgi:hypothetical protein
MTVACDVEPDEAGMAATAAHGEELLPGRLSKSLGPPRRHVSKSKVLPVTTGRRLSLSILMNERRLVAVGHLIAASRLMAPHGAADGWHWY